jgi:transcriptional regulator with XRE-family HTH domain
MVITPEQSRAARGFLDWSQPDLAKASNLSQSTVRDFEKRRRVPHANNLAAIKSAFETSGIAFIEANGGGPGVRLKTP